LNRNPRIRTQGTIVAGKQRNAPAEGAPGARPVSASRTELVEFVLPQDANALGTALGGRVMHFVDMAGAIAALRHCHAPVVTASIDHVDFRSPVQVGELMILKSSVNRTFHTSLEVGVKVFSENPLTGERRHTTSAYLTFVALDEERRPKTVPAVSCETDDDRRRYRQALVRRKARLAHRNR
jgi:acyl-CoA hydrolase